MDASAKSYPAAVNQKSASTVEFFPRASSALPRSFSASESLDSALRSAFDVNIALLAEAAVERVQELSLRGTRDERATASSGVAGFMTSSRLMNDKSQYLSAIRIEESGFSSSLTTRMSYSQLARAIP